MPLVGEIREKVPERFQAEPDFKALVGMIKQNDLNSKSELLDFLKKEISETEKWIEENKAAGGTMNINLRDKTVRLGTLKAAKKYAEDYL